MNGAQLNHECIKENKLGQFSCQVNNELVSDSVNLTWLTITTAQRMAYKATTVLPRIPTRHGFLSQVGGAFRLYVSGRGTLLIYIFNSLETTY